MGGPKMIKPPLTGTRTLISILDELIDHHNELVERMDALEDRMDDYVRDIWDRLTTPEGGTL